MIDRRSFITGLAAVIAAPAIVQVSSLMPVSSRALVASTVAEYMTIVGIDYSAASDMLAIAHVSLMPQGNRRLYWFELYHPALELKRMAGQPTPDMIIGSLEYGVRLQVTDKVASILRLGHTVKIERKA